ncbi:MFS transporter [Polycladomyces sp. WAk]|uniref:MFS transporter n=1 Tax=Polycladomyces zharkentensis TaxID=2807616 RepID=A0ABS2WJP5_9BACL|nr:MFS transporter [Polycladomyces sp. WAk]MBN2909744.1 MFS transporter [Polycladomyces sp. WAk]
MKSAGTVASLEDPKNSKQQWKWTLLASMANYIDSGSIVAGAASLSLWQSYFHMSNTALGLLAAFSSNAISAGIGALIGGRICDLFGRKRIYSWDLLVYAFGMLWIIFAVNAWMLAIGYFIVGLAVGADVPASWTIIAEYAPAKARGKLSGMAQVLWNMGPIVCLLLSLVLSPLGILGARLLFAHLFVVAIVTWLLRRGMVESVRWQNAVETATSVQSTVAGTVSKNFGVANGYRDLFTQPHLGALVFLISMYGIWNLTAGTSGFFLPYILETVGGNSQATSVFMQCLGFLFGVIGTALIFMPLSDRVNRRVLFGVSALIQVIGMSLLALFPLTPVVALLHVFLGGFASGFGQQAFFQLWSSELFPTMIRSTAQGLAFAVIRIGLGIWSLFVPVLTATGFTTLAWILTGFLIVSGLIGVIWAPQTSGKSLEEIEAERTALTKKV